MKAFWVSCDPWFVETYKSCATTVRRTRLVPFTVELTVGDEHFPQLFEGVGHDHLLVVMPNRQAEPVEIVPSQHIDFICKCGESPCQFCEGGLSSCVRCGSFEGATTTECPGEKIPQEKYDAVYEGRLDYVGGQWAWGACSKSSPQWRLSPGGKEEMQNYLANKRNHNAY